MGKRYVNYMEAAVEKSIEEYLRLDKELCRCDECAADLAALALNRLKPHYGTSLRGRAFLESREKTMDFIVEVVSAIKMGAEKIRANPRHPRRVK